MTIRLRARIIGRTLLTALLVFTTFAPAQTSPTFRTLYIFQGSDGAAPTASLIGSGGALYGTTSGGGTLGAGTVFSLTPPTSQGGAWTETVLHSFAGGPSDGANPEYSSVVIGSGGVLYGTTAGGGTSGTGTVFSLTPPASPGGAWTEAVLYSFAHGRDGAGPVAGVVIGSGGVLYGTTRAGGNSNAGTVFSLTPPASPGGAWTKAVLHRFTGGSDGTKPDAGVVIGSGGVLYGATLFGGTGSCNWDSNLGCGTVFSLTPPASPGGGWIETVLHNFAGYPSDGAYPWAGVLIGSGGVLYGTAMVYGTSNHGIVFSLTPPTSPGGAWTETVLHNFAGGDGSEPRAGVVIDKNGVLYGTTENGGTESDGTVFSLTPPTSPGGAWTEAVLHNFIQEAPWAGVVINKNGVLYGTTFYGGILGPNGTVYALKP